MFDAAVAHSVRSYSDAASESDHGAIVMAGRLGAPIDVDA
jgi:hypothetical protein